MKSLSKMILITLLAILLLNLRFSKEQISTDPEINNTVQIPAGASNRNVTGGIYLDEDEIYVDVDSENTTVKVTFTGYVNVGWSGIGEGVQVTMVNLSVSADGLSYGVSPKSLIFLSPEYGQDKLYSVQVYVPSNASSRDEFKLTVSAVATTLPQNMTDTLGSVNGIIKIEQFYRVACQPTQVNLTLKPGAIEEIHLTVQNLGNGPDHIRIGSPDNKRLEYIGIYYQGYEELTYVPENNSVIIPVQISAGKNVDTQEVDFVLRVISNEALEKGILTADSTVEIHLVIDNGDDENYIKDNWLTFVMIGVIFLLVFLFLVILLKRVRERKSG